MFLNEDTIKKALIFCGDDGFTFDNKNNPLEKTSSYFSDSKLHFTNLVFEWKSQQLELIIEGVDVNLPIDTHKKNVDKYKLVHKLINRLHDYRNTLLLKEYKEKRLFHLNICIGSIGTLWLLPLLIGAATFLYTVSFSVK